MGSNTGSELISSLRDQWISKWFDTVMRSYPEETAGFFRDTRDPFSNPVGSALEKGINDLFDVVTADVFDSRSASEALEPMIRVRALQDFSPSEALGFIPEIKSIIEQDPAVKKQNDKSLADRVSRIADNADKALLKAFDIYMDCKKHVYNLRASQARDNVRQLLIKKELISELPDIDPELTQ